MLVVKLPTNTIGRLAVQSVGAMIKRTHMIGRFVSIGNEETLSPSQALLITINLKLDVFLMECSKVSLVYIVKYLCSPAH